MIFSTRASRIDFLEKVPSGLRLEKGEEPGQGILGRGKLHVQRP